MEATSFKIRKSFNMVSNSPQVIKTSICPFYSRHGFCHSPHNLIHQECKNYSKYQYCFERLVNKCPYFHREMCSNWKRNGKCPIPECEYQHKNCENYQKYKICRRKDCPFFHSIALEKSNLAQEKGNKATFVRKMNNIRVTMKNDRNFIKKPSHNEIKSENLIANPDPERGASDSNVTAPKRLMSFNVGLHPMASDEGTLQNETENENFNLRAIYPPPRISETIEETKNEVSDHDCSINEEEEKKAAFFEEQTNRISNSPFINQDEDNRQSILQRPYENTRSSSMNPTMNRNRIYERQDPIQGTNDSPARIEPPFNRNRLMIRDNTIQRAAEDPPPRNVFERHGNLTIITLNRGPASQNSQNNQEVSSYPEGTIGRTLERLNQFSEQLRNIRDRIQNQEGERDSLNSRFRSLMQIQERLNFMRRQERIMGNIDSLIETFLLMNALSGNLNSVGLRLEEFEKLPIFLYGVDDQIKTNEANYEDSSTRTMCAICLEDYKLNDLVRRLYCSHQYHEECLREWTKKKINCPVCKKNMREDIQKNENKKI